MKTGIEIRLEMAAKGWRSHDQITDMGWGDKGMGYSIWFERWDWHGENLLKTTGNKACYHAHSSGLANIDATVRKAADEAQQAWDAIG